MWWSLIIGRGDSRLESLKRRAVEAIKLANQKAASSVEEGVMYSLLAVAIRIIKKNKKII